MRDSHVSIDSSQESVVAADRRGADVGSAHPATRHLVSAMRGPPVRPMQASCNTREARGRNADKESPRVSMENAEIFDPNCVIAFCCGCNDVLRIDPDGIAAVPSWRAR